MAETKDRFGSDRSAEVTKQVVRFYGAHARR
jgi:hypothetical protein